MSREAIEWVLKARGLNIGPKCIYFMLGHYFNPKWGYAWVSHELLAENSELSERQLIRHLRTLEEGGYVEVARGSHHTATKYRLRLELPPPTEPKTTAIKSWPKQTKRKVSVFQKPLESGSQDFIRGDTFDTPEIPVRGDTSDTPESAPGVSLSAKRGDTSGESGVTLLAKRGDISSNELCVNRAHQQKSNPVYVNPDVNSQEIKKRDPENVKQPLLQPGADVCPQPGETGGSSGDQQSKSSFSELTTTGVLEPESADIGPGLPDPYEAYRRNIGSLKPMLEEQIRAAEERYGSAWIVEAIGIAVSQNSPRWAYVEGILRKWGSEGRGMLGESTDQRHNRSKYLEEFNRRWGCNPWEASESGEAEEWAVPAQIDEPLENATEAAKLWGQALAELRGQMDKPTFETWLADTRGIGFDDVRFAVEVKTPFSIAWLERRMYQTIQKTVEKLMGKVLNIQFQVREQSCIQPQGESYVDATE